MDSTHILIDGQTLEIPAGLAASGLTGNEILQRAGKSAGGFAYEVTPEGHRVLPPHERTQLKPGATYGTMGRMVAGGDLLCNEGAVIDLASVDGVTFEVPPGGALMLPQEIKTVAQAEHKPILYRVSKDGHEVLQEKQRVTVRPGDQFGTLQRVVAGGRDHRRIQAEFKLLQHQYGEQMVDWTPSLEWLRIQGFRLPAGYNMETTPVLIHVPDTYGLGVPIRECYVNPGLRFRQGFRWAQIPHYFDLGDAYSPRSGVKQEGWGYFCVHCVEWGPRSNFLTFLNAAFTVLSNPFHPWPT